MIKNVVAFAPMFFWWPFARYHQTLWSDFFSDVILAYDGDVIITF